MPNGLSTIDYRPRLAQNRPGSVTFFVMKSRDARTRLYRSSKHWTNARTLLSCLAWICHASGLWAVANIFLIICSLVRASFHLLCSNVLLWKPKHFRKRVRIFSGDHNPPENPVPLITTPPPNLNVERFSPIVDCRAVRPLSPLQFNVGGRCGCTSRGFACLPRDERPQK